VHAGVALHRGRMRRVTAGVTRGRWPEGQALERTCAPSTPDGTRTEASTALPREDEVDEVAVAHRGRADREGGPDRPPEVPDPAPRAPLALRRARQP
jgi:hypothetical protein